MASSPKTCLSFPFLVVALSQSLTQKQYGILLRDVPWFSVHDKVHKHLDISSTYSTLRHCTTMPLQVGMEEGPRSKAVLVSGLQYCL
jgi:hypothetical protein